MIGSRDASADDQSQSFLKKKEEELRQKRERERQTAEAKSKQTADATFTMSPPSVVTAAKVATTTLTPSAGTAAKLEFVAVTTVSSPTETVSSSLISAPVRSAAATTSAVSKVPKPVATSTVPAEVTTAPYQPARPVRGANANIPPFYFPLGAPTPGTVDVEEPAMRKIREEFEKVANGQMEKSALGPVLKVCLQFCVVLMKYLIEFW